jgi:hypothetical protein
MMVTRDTIAETLWRADPHGTTHPEGPGTEYFPMADAVWALLTEAPTEKWAYCFAHQRPGFSCEAERIDTRNHTPESQCDMARPVVLRLERGER